MSALKLAPGATIRITHELLAIDVAWALAWWWANEVDDDEPMAPLGAAEITSTVRRLYTDHGTSWQSDGWADDLTREREAEIRRWAYEQVRRHWPRVASSIPPSWAGGA